MNICITGGSGFIGSHCCIELLEQGYNVIIIDNLSNSSTESLDRILKITGKKPEFLKLDLCNYKQLYDFFVQNRNKIDCVIHCAALKSISESNKDPIKYYDNNVVGTINLLKCMRIGNCKKLVFSSSATVYGECIKIPIEENSKLNVLNPYGRTKLYVEEILNDLIKVERNWSIIVLRYFNPIGAHSSHKLGEMTYETPANLLPYILDVAIGKQKHLSIYGNDYETPDGTCIRDYIHIMDLAKGHMAAIKKIQVLEGEILTVNLGTGTGYSVMDIINKMKEVTGVNIPYVVEKRREGDAAICFASTDLAYKELGWKTEKTLHDMCLDAWKWKQEYYLNKN